MGAFFSSSQLTDGGVRPETGVRPTGSQLGKPKSLRKGLEMLEDREMAKLEMLKAQFEAEEDEKKKNGRNRSKKPHRIRMLKPELKPELLSPAQRRRLSNQGSRGAGESCHVPGLVLSVQLESCGHRARVEVLASGQVPARARCQRCLRWRDAEPGTARRPVQTAQREVVEERVEVRDGERYRVQVLKTPPRARQIRSMQVGGMQDEPR